MTRNKVPPCGPRLDPEGDGAVGKWSAFLPHSVPDLDAGNGRDGLGFGEIGLRQPSLAKGREGDRPPHLFRSRVEFELERDFGFLAGIARNVAH